MSDLDGLDVLAKSLTPMEMELLGTSLKAGQPLALALAGVHPRKARKTRIVVDQLLQAMDKKIVGVALLAMSSAAKTATSEIEVVWSGPTPHGALGRTTWAVLDEVVQNAHEFIYAATYSAGNGAPAIRALRGALDRGVSVTCMVDVHNRPEAVAILKNELPGARLLGLSAHENMGAPLMHAKFIVVDGHSTFLSSANFSNLAVDKSLEVGLLVHNSFVAHQFRLRIEEMLLDGLLEPV